LVRLARRILVSRGLGFLNSFFEFLDIINIGGDPDKLLVGKLLSRGKRIPRKFIRARILLGSNKKAENLLLPARIS